MRYEACHFKEPKFWLVYNDITRSVTNRGTAILFAKQDKLGGFWRIKEKKA